LLVYLFILMFSTLSISKDVLVTGKGLGAVVRVTYTAGPGRKLKNFPNKIWGATYQANKWCYVDWLVPPLTTTPTEETFMSGAHQPHYLATSSYISIGDELE
jgi:hypothetical protein